MTSLNKPSKPTFTYEIQYSAENLFERLLGMNYWWRVERDNCSVASGFARTKSKALRKVTRYKDYEEGDL